MPLWTDALIGDTTHLSTREFGAYMLLLIATWRHNGEPFADDDQILARICRMTTYEWKQIRKRVAPFFNLADGSWRQKRLEKEWEACSSRRSSSRRSGAMGGRPKKAKPLEENEPGNPAGYVEANLDRTSKKAILNPSHIGSVSPGGDTAPQAAQPDPIKAMWQDALAILGDTLHARSLLGKMRKQYGDPAVLSAIAACQATQPSDPMPFFVRCCEQHSGSSAPGGNGHARSPTDKIWAGAFRAYEDYERSQGDSDAGGEDALPLLGRR